MAGIKITELTQADAMSAEASFVITQLETVGSSQVESVRRAGMEATVTALKDAGVNDGCATDEDIGELKAQISTLPVEYHCELGNVYGTGIEADDNTKMRTPKIDCSNIKQFKLYRPSGVVINAYVGVVNGQWQSVASLVTVTGNLCEVDATVATIRFVFRKSNNTEISQEELANTYVFAYTEDLETIDAIAPVVDTLNNRNKWSITRYTFRVGYVNVRNEFVADNTKCVSDVVESGKVKSYKIIIPNGFVMYSSIGYSNGAWGKVPITIVDGKFVVSAIAEKFRINFRKSNDGVITEEEAGSIYILPYIDANQEIDELNGKIEDAKEEIHLNVEGAGYSARYLHASQRAGTGKKPYWTIVDDDGRKEAIDIWLPIMQSKNIKMTIPVITSKIGNDSDWLTWEQVKTLAEAGAEICSHTDSHPDLTTLTETELRTEFSTSLGTLYLHGYNNPYLVYPQNRHNELVRRVAAEYFDCGVGYETNLENNIPPIRTYRLTRREIGNSQTLAECKSLIDNIVANDGWLITMSHSQPTFMLHPEIIAEMIDYAKSSGVTICTLREGLNAYANVVEIGDTSDAWYTGISADGMPFGRLNQYIVTTPPSNFNGNNIFDCFQRLTRVTLAINSAQGSSYGYPQGSSGGVLDILVFSGNYYSNMIFRPLGTNKTYRREYSNGWLEWNDIS